MDQDVSALEDSFHALRVGHEVRRQVGDCTANKDGNSEIRLIFFLSSFTTSKPASTMFSPACSNPGFEPSHWDQQVLSRRPSKASTRKSVSRPSPPSRGRLISSVQRYIPSGIGLPSRSQIHLPPDSSPDLCLVRAVAYRRFAQRQSD